MKRLFVLLISVLILGGCSTRDVENRLDAMGEKVGDGISKIMSSSEAQGISRQEAVAIALQHTGVTESQVKGLRTEYEVDDGVGHYDVRFLLDGQEYNYEISATDGKIISYEVDE